MKAASFFRDEAPRVKQLTEFTGLIERRLRARWLFAALLLAAATLFGLRPALAGEAPHSRHPKIAGDLHDAIAGNSGKARRWMRSVRGQRTVQVIVVAEGSDKEMRALRAEIQKLGGTVQATHGLVNAMTVQIPAQQVAALAALADVKSLSPNRDVVQTASLIETTTGALTPNVRSYAYGSYTGLDGSGVGIAILDSGIMKRHRNFNDGAYFPTSRVTRSVDMRNANVANWSAGGLLSLMPGSSQLASGQKTKAGKPVKSSSIETARRALGPATCASEACVPAPSDIGVAKPINAQPMK